MPGRVATRFARPAYLAPCRAGGRRAGRLGFQSVNKSGATVGPNTADRPDSPMLIVCPTCATSYDVELASLQPNGRQVRCVRCRTIWRAAPSHADKLLAAAEAIGPEPQVAQAPAALLPRNRRCSRPMSRPLTAARGRRRTNCRPPTPAAAEMDAGEPDAAVEVEAPSIAPVDLDDGQPPIEVEHTAEQDAEPLEDIETYAARRQKRGFRRPSLHWPLSNLQSGILALLIVDAILVGWRNDVVRILPQTASFYSMLGLLGELARAGARRRHHDHGAARRRADPRGRRQRRQRQPQDRRRAAAEIRGPQLSQRGNLFLDRGAAARDACRPAKPCRSAAVSPRRQPTAATCWCVSSPATTSSPGHDS